jgi:deoxyribonuclease IV
VLIGAHVRGGGALVDRLERGVELGADAIQVFTQSPRAWKPTQYAPDVLATYREAARAHPTVRATFCHATYLINLATPDDTLYARSVDCLVNNLSVARGMAASGLVLHIGSHKGAGTEGAIARVAAGLRRALDEAEDPGDAAAPPCPILLENAAGAGGTVGRTLEELEAVLAATGADEQLGVCIDTQHLWASGVDYTSVELADGVVDEVRSRFGLERLGCLHLNDSKVDLGSNRDRHENLGDGTIGASGLASLLGHPDLASAPALLEVPGDGDGPRAVDVDAARAILEDGTSMRPARRPAKKGAKLPRKEAMTTSKRAPKKGVG